MQIAFFPNARNKAISPLSLKERLALISYMAMISLLVELVRLRTPASRRKSLASRWWPNATSDDLIGSNFCVILPSGHYTTLWVERFLHLLSPWWYLRSINQTGVQPRFNDGISETCTPLVDTLAQPDPSTSRNQGNTGVIWYVVMSDVRDDVMCPMDEVSVRVYLFGSSAG